MRPSDTWICVADGARAQFYRCDGPGHEIEPLLDCNLAASSHGPSAGTGGTRFAGQVASRLDSAAAGRLFEHLVLVAPAGMLRELRDCLKAQTRNLVVGEVDRDLTHATPREVACHLGGVLPH
jgi:protein required for attachment to host cells